MAIIKAGTYRWNDEIELVADASYRLPIKIPISWVADDTIKSCRPFEEPTIIIGEGFEMSSTEFRYTIVSEQYYIDAYNTTSRWNRAYDSMVEQGYSNAEIAIGSYQTFTVTVDTEVDDTFATWFTENTQMLIKAGTYRWNDTLLPFNNGNTSSGIDYLIPFTINVENQQIDEDLFYTGIIYSNGFSAGGTDSSVFIVALSEYSIPANDLFSGGTLYLYNSYSGYVLGDQVRIFTVTEDQYVSTDFGLWATSNWQEYVTEPSYPDFPTEDSIKAKIQYLINKANKKTNKGDTDLTNAVNNLIDGYGQGGTATPEWDGFYTITGGDEE